MLPMISRFFLICVAAAIFAHGAGAAQVPDRTGPFPKVDTRQHRAGANLTTRHRDGSPVETILYSFKNQPDGAIPLAGVFADKKGDLYGTTWDGGTGNCSGGCGTVYRLTRQGSTYVESVIHSFQQNDGLEPNASVIVDKTGAVYGTTTGGRVNAGTAFKLVPSGSRYVEHVLHWFGGGTDGVNPYGGLIADKKGALYGTTLGGGTANQGTVFKLTPQGNGYKESILYSFQGGQNDGSGPTASLVADNSGALYSTTQAGGTFDVGTLFKLTLSKSGYTESTLYSFRGDYVEYGVIMDKSGAFFGATAGIYNNVFKLTPSGSGYTDSTIHTFGLGGGRSSVPPDGNLPYGPVFMDGTGAIYGTTYDGGDYLCMYGCGIVYKLTQSGSYYVETVLYRFQGYPDGANSYSGVIADASGNLYGTTQQGGTSNGCSFGCGTVFKITP